MSPRSSGAAALGGSDNDLRVADFPVFALRYVTQKAYTVLQQLAGMHAGTQ